MLPMKRVLLSAALCGAFTTGAHATIQVMTGFETTPAFLSSGTEAHVLTSITDASGTYTDLRFTTTDDISPTNTFGILYGVNGTPPADGNDALSDNRVDTGKLQVGQFTLFDVSAPVSATDKFFLIFNAGTTVFFQGPGTVVAENSLGDPLGSITVNEHNSPNDIVLESDMITTADLARIGASTLTGRPIYGITADISDFGIADPSTIAAFRITGEILENGNGTVDSFDINVVGIAATAPPTLEGDLDGDGFVGISDLNMVLGNWNQTIPPGDPLADPSGDGFVGIEDLNTVLGNWNNGTPPPSVAVPEPASLGLLIMGASFAIARRRR